MGSEMCIRDRDSPKGVLIHAHSEMIKQVELYENDQTWRATVITRTAEKLGFPEDRVSDYFRSEVRNRMSQDDIDGLLLFLEEACGMLEPPVWLNPYSV